MNQMNMQNEIYKNKNKTMVKAPKEGKVIFFEAPSATVPDRKYAIRVMSDGEVRCACTANVMGKKCVHIKYFLKIYNENYEKLMGDINSSDLVAYKEAEKEKKKVAAKEEKSEDFASGFPF